MKKYQYTIRVWQSHIRSGNIVALNAVEWVDWLNTMGDKGWELVSHREWGAIPTREATFKRLL